MLPHRYPFLLIDRVVAFELGKKLVAIKNVTINEPFFQGHFPGHPVMPGVLIIEAMAQACGVLIKLSAPHERQHTGRLLSGQGRQGALQPHRRAGRSAAASKSSTNARCAT